MFSCNFHARDFGVSHCRDSLYSMEVQYPLFLTPLLALLCTIVMQWFVVRYFPTLHLLDFPDRYGLQRKRLPYPAGIVAPIIFIALFPLLQNSTTQSLGLLVAIVLLGLVSFIDDRYPLPPLLRLSIQGLCAGIIVTTGSCVGGRICSITNPLYGFVGSEIIDIQKTVPLLTIFLSMLWIMITTNALNWFDGIPGQTTAIATTACITIGLLSLSERVNQPALAAIAFTVAMIAFGCFLFDFPPPRVVLGDSGSMFFGLILGTLTIYAGGKIATAFLVLGVPIIDLFFVITKRLLEKRSPFKGSMHGEHLHHRLLAKGWNPKQIILLTVSIGTVFGVSALFLNTAEKFGVALFLMLCMAGLWKYSKPEPHQAS